MSNQKTTQMVVNAATSINPLQGTEQVVLFNPDGTPAGVAPDTGATVKLTGYATTTGVHALSATDTVNAALAKVESRLAILEA